jgi:hypothetical protein
MLSHTGCLSGGQDAINTWEQKVLELQPAARTLDEDYYDWCSYSMF